MVSPLLTRLDEIEQLNLEPGVNAEALDIMEAFAQGSEQLATLVERYAGSRSENIASYLAFFLAEKAEDPAPEFYGLLSSFIEKLRYQYQWSILSSCLNVLWLLLIHDCIWQPRSQPPDFLYPFLRRCLDYSYSSLNAVYVQRWAVQVTSYLYEKGLLEEILNPMQLSWLRERLLHLLARKLDDLDGELTWLPEFVAKEHLFVHSPLLERLDEFERRTSGGVEDESKFVRPIFSLMEAFAQGTDWLWILVERYGDSRSRTCMLTLTSLVARMSESPNVDTLPIVLSLIEKIRAKDEPVAYATCLRSVQQQTLYGHTWQQGTQAPTVLYPFLQHCLDYPDTWARHEALRLLALLCQRNLLSGSVPANQLALLYESAAQASTAIRNQPGGPLDETIPDLSLLARCLTMP